MIRLVRFNGYVEIPGIGSLHQITCEKASLKIVDFGVQVGELIAVPWANVEWVEYSPAPIPEPIKESSKPIPQHTYNKKGK